MNQTYAGCVLSLATRHLALILNDSPRPHGAARFMPPIDNGAVSISANRIRAVGAWPDLNTVGGRKSFGPR